MQKTQVKDILHYIIVEIVVLQGLYMFTVLSVNCKRC